nr:unnamed protein product [Callosobruchus analis]
MIQEFDFKVMHCPGPQNIIADTLSRQVPTSKLKMLPEQSNNIKIMLTKMSNDYEGLKLHFKSMLEHQLGEVWIREKLLFLEGLATRALILSKKELSVSKWFLVHEGLLFKRGDALNPGYKSCIPKSQVRDLVIAHHNDLGHFGKSKVYMQMRSKFFWPRMQKHIGQLVSSCDICQRAKCSEKCHGKLHSVLPQNRGELVCTDLIGPLPSSRGGATQILVFVDAFSKYVKVYALKKATASAILNRFLNHYVKEIQKPKCVLSDNGTQFTSKQWRNALSKEGIRNKYTSVYFPEGNMTERYNREIGRILRTYCYDQHTRWAYILDYLEFCLNNAINESTGFAPVLLQFGRAECQPINKYLSFPVCEEDEGTQGRVLMLARERLLSKAERRAEKTKFHRSIEFKEGDKVLLRSHHLSSAEDKVIKKFFLLFEGPYWVARQAGPNSYVLKDDKGRWLPHQNVVNLKPYREPLEALV